jgi:hypothetical protein
VITGGRFKHPYWHFHRSVIALILNAAPTERMSAFGYRFVHRDTSTEPRMPRVPDFSRFSIVGVALSSCTIGIVLIGHWVSFHQLHVAFQTRHHLIPRLVSNAAIVSADCFMSTVWSPERDLCTLQGNGAWIVKPETVIAWHRRGFRLWWTWKSRHPMGRRTVSADVRMLIRTMAQANPR